MKKHNDLKNKVVIITGGAGGIGKASAERFIEEGAKVMLADFNEEAAMNTAKELGTYGENVAVVKVDVADYDSVANMIEETVKVFGTMDILFNNAGITLSKPFLEQTKEDYQRIIGINQTGVFNGMHLFAKKMVELGKGGTIINTSSIASRMASMSTIGYTSSKAAVNMLTQSGAMDLAPYGIRVVGVAPAVINTPMIQEFKGKMKEYLENMHMRRNILEASQIANVVVFLAKEEASGINGQVIFVDDGYTNFKI